MKHDLIGSRSIRTYRIMDIKTTTECMSRRFVPFAAHADKKLKGKNL